MAGPRYWWQERSDDDRETTVAAAPARCPRLALAPPDLDRLRRYRAELTRKALRLPRGSGRRRETEKTLIRVTAQVLRLELRAR